MQRRHHTPEPGRRTTQTDCFSVPPKARMFAIASPIYNPDLAKGARIVAGNDLVVSRDPDVMHGELVFTGTRVPAKTLVDYIKAGHTLDDFLEGFPKIGRAHV